MPGECLTPRLIPSRSFTFNHSFITFHFTPCSLSYWKSAVKWTTDTTRQLEPKGRNEWSGIRVCSLASVSLDFQKSHLSNKLNSKKFQAQMCWLKIIMGKCFNSSVEGRGGPGVALLPLSRHSRRPWDQLIMLLTVKLVYRMCSGSPQLFLNLNEVSLPFGCLYGSLGIPELGLRLLVRPLCQVHTLNLQWKVYPCVFISKSLTVIGQF
jgi:hypothetical protein